MGPCEQSTATSSTTWSWWSYQCNEFQRRWYDDDNTEMHIVDVDGDDADNDDS